MRYGPAKSGTAVAAAASGVGSLTTQGYKIAFWRYETEPMKASSHGKTLCTYEH